MPGHEKSGIWVSGPPDGNQGGHGKIRLLVVDDHPAYRQGLRSTFDLEPDIEVVGEAGSGDEAFEQAGLLRPDLVLMDVNMPGMTGMEATRKLTDAYPGILVLILTMFKDQEHLREARRAGASAYVMKDAGTEILLQTIRDTMQGEHPLLQREDYATEPLSPNRLPAQTVRQPSLGTDALVSPHERSILAMIAKGHTNDEIADKIGAPEAMVRTYLAEIYRKLGLKGREDAARYARQRGITDE
jgi:DNA-binding NarL/FixJ family response regulator